MTQENKESQGSFAGCPVGQDISTPGDNEVEASQLKKMNPFSAAYSGYGHVVDGKFESAYPPGSDQYNFHVLAHNYVDAKIRDPRFPCILGQTAVKTGQISFSAYTSDITTPEVAEGILYDLVRFQHEFGVPGRAKGRGGILRSSLIAFNTPQITDELHGVSVLYKLLKTSHEINARFFDWAEGFSNELDSPDFGFSAGDTAYFIAYFHPQASWEPRRSDVSFIVLNSHHVLGALKATGMDNFERVKEIIRRRQPQPVHPYLGNHGAVPEFRQYTLLPATDEMEIAEAKIRSDTLGECPFQPNKDR